MSEGCTKHAEKLHRHIQHMIEHYKRSTGTKRRHWNLPERLSCEQIDAILDHVSRWSVHDGSHPFVPVARENKKIPNLSCAGCKDSILTFAVENAYNVVVFGVSVEKKNNPQS